MPNPTIKTGLAALIIALLTTSASTAPTTTANTTNNRINACSMKPLRECIKRIELLGADTACVVDRTSGNYPVNFCGGFEHLQGLAGIWGTLDPDTVYSQSSCGDVLEAVHRIVDRCLVDTDPVRGEMVGGYEYPKGNGHMKVTVRPNGPYLWEGEDYWGNIFCWESEPWDKDNLFG